jgi:L-ribulose-5-phosphate 4-epimerase
MPEGSHSVSDAIVSSDTALREAVLEANLATVREGLVLSTFGNASAVDRASGRILIKPSGVPYEQLTPDDIVACDLSGRPLGNRLRPSSDIDTHAELYAAFPEIGAVVHTHSTYATIMAQAECQVPVLGTTHADYFHGAIPVTRRLTDDEIRTDYVANTGRVIVEAFEGMDPMSIPAVLVAGHGPFVWGRDPSDAVHNAVILEQVARMAWHALTLSPGVEPISQALLDRHYRRKHGDTATYGQ